MKPNSRRLPAILCLCASLAACDFDPGADSGQGPSALDDAGLRDGASAAGSQDGGAEVAGTFFVVSTTPEAGAKGVALDAGVTLTFSVPIDPSTLTAASVRLLDETGAELPASLTAEGAVAKLTPLAPLTLLTGFRVEVSQNVRSQSGAGLVSSFSLEFESREGTWSEPLVLDANLGEDLRQPAVAMNDRGGALVVWSVLTPAFFPTSGAILATYRPSGGQWSLPTALNGPGELSAFPSLAAREGKAWAVWQTFPTPGRLARRVVAAMHDGRQWAPPVVLSETDNAELAALQVVALSNGKALAVWELHDPKVERRQIEASLFVGGNWQPPVVLSDAVDEALRPHVVPVAEGAAVSWIAYDTKNDSDISVRVFDGAAWGLETSLGVGVGWPYGPREVRLVPSTPSGFTAVWFAHAPGEKGVDGATVAAVTFDAGQPSPAVDLRGGATGVVKELAVASSPGPALATWCGAGGCWLGSRGAAGWTSFVLGEVPAWAFPVVARDPRNNGLVGWLRSAADKTFLGLKRIRAGKVDGVAPEAFSRLEKSAWYPALAMDPSGTALVAWTENTPAPGITGGSLWVRVFE